MVFKNKEDSERAVVCLVKVEREERQVLCNLRTVIKILSFPATVFSGLRG
jgi:hypothetical protein